MDMLATDLADYLVRKGVSYSFPGYLNKNLTVPSRSPSERHTTFLDAQSH